MYFKRFKILHLVNYLVLGWIGVFYIGKILDNVGPIGSALLIAGGVSYTIGFVFYSLKKFKYTHFIWHLFVLAGTILHFLAIYLYL
jgi:hemolysin III